MTDLIKKIEENRSIILQSEIGAVLHDLGKLSKEFLKYRQPRRRRDDPNWWDNDPHHDKLIIPEPLKELFDKKWDVSIFSGKDAESSIARIIHKHTAPDKADYDEPNLHKSNKPDVPFLNILKAADAKDAAIDRNNPLFTAEQEGEVIYDTDVFGAEGTKQQLKIVCYDKRRDDLYSKIHSQLESYLKFPNKITFENRDNLFNIIECSFDQTLSDTTRPSNDTSLWEHSYAVASIFKVSLLHQLIYGERLDSFPKVRFGILGIGWDGLGFISKGEKIGDILGKKAEIDELKDEIRKKVEFEHLLGNSIYDDDNGIYFLIPSIAEKIDIEKTDFDSLSEYGKLLQKVRDEVRNYVIALTNGDIYPHFHLIQETGSTTRIVECIQKVREKTLLPISSPDENHIKTLNNDWEKNSGKTICPICQQRPIINDRWDICNTCKDRRKKGHRDPQQTPFIQEIVLASPTSKSSSNKAALIVAKFGLEGWLDGRMIRSLFIAEAKGLERELADLGNTKQFEKEEQEVWQSLSTNYPEDLIGKRYDYARIKEEIDLCYGFDKLTDEKKKQYARDILFLYDRRIKYDCKTKTNKLNREPAGIKNQWDSFIDTAIEEYGLKGSDVEGLLYNLICAKTPTPSTVLDVWNATREFFESLPQDFGIEKRTRYKLQVPKPDGIDYKMVYKGMIDGEKVEILWKEENQALVIEEENQPEWKGKIVLEGKPLPSGKKIPTAEIADVTKDEYYPFRVITTTPDLFLAIVPADKALHVSRLIYQRYIEQFGKVMGRLPFSIGHIFFKKKTPMFVILDSARRMIRNFENLHKIPVEARVSKDHQKNNPTQENISIKIDRLNLHTTQIERTIKWKLPYKLGDQNIDYFHPYFLVKEKSKDYSFRKNYFNTVPGEVVHFTEIEPGDILKVYPNYYDFEFLDSTARRYDIALDSNYRRKSNITNLFSKPYLLDELKQGIEELWNLLRKDTLGMTDTKLRNIESLWLTKLEEWKRNDTDRKQWENLVKATIGKEFKGLNEEKIEFLEQSVFSGLFFDCLELNLRILKKKVKEKDNETK